MFYYITIYTREVVARVDTIIIVNQQYILVRFCLQVHQIYAENLSSEGIKIMTEREREGGDKNDESCFCCVFILFLLLLFDRKRGGVCFVITLNGAAITMHPAPPRPR